MNVSAFFLLLPPFEKEKGSSLPGLRGQGSHVVWLGILFTCVALAGRAQDWPTTTTDTVEPAAEVVADPKEPAGTIFVTTDSLPSSPPQVSRIRYPKPYIIVAHDTDYPPFEFVDEDGRPDGYGLEVIRAAAKRLGLQVRFLPTTWKNVLEALENGRADVTPEMMHSPYRQENWYLGKPWGKTTSSVFVPSAESITTLAELKGKRIAVPENDIEQEELTRLGGFELVAVPNVRQALTLVILGVVEAAACNQDVALYEIARVPRMRARLRYLEKPIAITPYSIAGMPANRVMIDDLTDMIDEMRRDGSLETIYVNWFLRHSDDFDRRVARERLGRHLVIGLLVFAAIAAIVGALLSRRQKRRLEKLVQQRTQELAHSEQHYRALFDHARDAILLVNPTNRVVSEMNPSAERLTGRPRSKLLGQPIDILFPPEEMEKANIFLFQQKSDQSSSSMLVDLTLVRPKGERLIAQTRGALVGLKEGTSLYVVFRDVTEAAHARKQLEHRNNELRIQNALATALQRDLPIGKRLREGLDTILGLEEFKVHHRGAVYVRHARELQLTLAALCGIEGIVTLETLESDGEESPQKAITVLPSESGLLQRVMQGELIFVDSCHNDAFLGFPTLSIGEHGHYLVPLRAEGKTNGILCLFTDTYVPIEERRRALLEGLGSQLGIVIESDRRQQELKDREHRLESLSGIAISLGSSLDLTEQLKVLFTQIRRVMPADAGNVWVADSDPFQGEAEVYYSYDTREDRSLVESTIRHKGTITPGTSIHKVFTLGEPLTILRTEEEASRPTSSQVQFGLERRSRSLLYVPLKIKGRVIGVLTVQSYRPNAYKQETVDVLMSLSAPLAVVIENARLFEAVEQRRNELDQSLQLIEADLKAAQAAQESLLPREFPAIAGWEFASVFIPSQYVGGDFYNVFRLDERHIGLYHIDVSGHGVPAALFSVGLNQYLMRDLLGPGVMREQGENPGSYRVRSPEEVVAFLDRENMFQKYQRFFTMLYLVADVEKGLVKFYRAGHNEPLLLRRGEAPRYLSGGGPLIGFQLPRTRAEIQEIQLQPGDRMIIYSDGLNEASDASGDLYGMERMAAFLAATNGNSLQASFNNLVEDVRRFCGAGHFEDDVSMIGMIWDPGRGITITTDK